PRFDSGACCAALLGGPEHGCWALAPASHSRAGTRRRYRPDTLILETEFTTAHAAVTLIDFMPIRDRGSHVIRIVRGRRGRVRMRFQLILRFDYGELIPWVTRLEDGRLSFVAGPHRLILSTPVKLRGEHLTTVGEFVVAAGESVAFTLSYSDACAPVPRPIGPVAALRATERFWREWVGESSQTGEYSEAVRRSLITLKALTYRPSGGILAAPTTSLPERIGGERNWDYRYCWLRDATFTLQAMMNTAHYEEAEAWRSWLLRAAAGDADKLQILYSVTGERLQPEWELPWLPGYEQSAPVRIGNAASEQLQLDVFGELMEVLHQARCSKLAGKDAGWQLQLSLLEHLEQIWRRPDRGIWEIRGAPRHFTHSKVMAWVAIDRAIRSAEQFHLEAPLRRWRRLRQRMHRDICRRGFNRRVGAFVRSYGSRDVDASTLLLPLVGFLPVTDARIRGTVEAIERRLLRDGLVRRYESRAGDGLRGGEGMFLACSFWLADNYVLLGRRDDARRLFERLLTLRNDVGLLSEEYDTTERRFLGNFPQSLSHIALVNTALNLMRREGPAKQRAENRGHAARRRKHAPA
ncbi:MAG TPA: glycoside hydrolase family 15 protein, partial [Steroidobacteraceae bacterium]|nr:glycoside hydrolase family 15 protein [Steroidobacteraceae bacterium]